MKRLILISLFLTSLIVSLQALSLGAQEPAIARADKLFAARDNLESLKQAVSITEELRAKEQSNYEALWRLAKFRYYLADREEDKSKKGRLKLVKDGTGYKTVAESDPGQDMLQVVFEIVPLYSTGFVLVFYSLIPKFSVLY